MVLPKELLLRYCTGFLPKHAGLRSIIQLVEFIAINDGNSGARRKLYKVGFVYIFHCLTLSLSHSRNDLPFNIIDLDQITLENPTLTSI